MRNLKKRRSKSNPAVRRMTERKEVKRLENAMDAMHAEEILHDNSAGVIEAETDMEKTTQMTQEKLKGMLEENVARNIYDLELGDYSPYVMKYDRSGRYSLLCGRKGHVAVIDQHTMGLRKEFHLGERTRDACFLQDGSLMAVAQERNVFIYDENGAEVHRLDGHKRVFGMEFLPYHWLLGEFSCAIMKHQFVSSRTLITCECVPHHPLHKSNHWPRWFSPIPRHIHRRNRLTASYQTRAMSNHTPKPTQCRLASWPHQRNSHSLVTFQFGISRKNAVSQG